MNITLASKYILGNLRVLVRHKERVNINKEIGGLIYGTYSFWKGLHIEEMSENSPKNLTDLKMVIGHWHNHPSGNDKPSYADEMTMTANSVNKKIPFLCIVTHSNKGTKFTFYKYTLFRQRKVKEIYLHSHLRTRKSK